MKTRLIENLEPRLMLAASFVADLNKASLGSSISMLGHLGNLAIFSENDAVHGIEPYRSDGTKAGTFLLRARHRVVAERRNTHRNETVRGSRAGLRRQQSA